MDNFEHHATTNQQSTYHHQRFLENMEAPLSSLQASPLSVRKEVAPALSRGNPNMTNASVPNPRISGPRPDLDAQIESNSIKGFGDDQSFIYRAPPQPNFLQRVFREKYSMSLTEAIVIGRDEKPPFPALLASPHLIWDEIPLLPRDLWRMECLHQESVPHMTDVLHGFCAIIRKLHPGYEQFGRTWEFLQLVTKYIDKGNRVYSDAYTRGAHQEASQIKQERTANVLELLRKVAKKLNDEYPGWFQKMLDSPTSSALQLAIHPLHDLLTPAQKMWIHCARKSRHIWEVDFAQIPRVLPEVFQPTQGAYDPQTGYPYHPSDILNLRAYDPRDRERWYRIFLEYLERLQTSIPGQPEFDTAWDALSENSSQLWNYEQAMFLTPPTHVNCLYVPKPELIEWQEALQRTQFEETERHGNDAVSNQEEVVHQGTARLPDIQEAAIPGHPIALPVAMTEDHSEHIPEATNMQPNKGAVIPNDVLEVTGCTVVAEPHVEMDQAEKDPQAETDTVEDSTELPLTDENSGLDVLSGPLDQPSHFDQHFDRDLFGSSPEPTGVTVVEKPQHELEKAKKNPQVESEIVQNSDELPLSNSNIDVSPGSLHQPSLINEDLDRELFGSSPEPTEVIVIAEPQFGLEEAEMHRRAGIEIVQDSTELPLTNNNVNLEVSLGSVDREEFDRELFGSSPEPSRPSATEPYVEIPVAVAPQRIQEEQLGGIERSDGSNPSVQAHREGIDRTVTDAPNVNCATEQGTPSLNILSPLNQALVHEIPPPVSRKRRVEHANDGDEHRDTTTSKRQRQNTELSGTNSTPQYETPSDQTTHTANSERIITSERSQRASGKRKASQITAADESHGTSLAKRQRRMVEEAGVLSDPTPASSSRMSQVSESPTDAGSSAVAESNIETSRPQPSTPRGPTIERERQWEVPEEYQVSRYGFQRGLPPSRVNALDVATGGGYASRYEWLRGSKNQEHQEKNKRRD